MNELDAIRAQIADHQQRITALEQTPPSTARDGSLAELVALGVKLASSVARVAADAGGRPASATPAPGAPSPLRDRIRSARTAAQAAQDATAQVRRAPQESVFPITEPKPAAQYAGRTAPRRTLPPETPVRLWNQDHTDHLDATARSTMTPGVTRLLVTRGAEDALMWLRELDGGTFAAWLDREWVVAAWTHTPRLRSGELTLDLLPIPKPPRVDEVLGREPLNIAEVRAGAEAMRATPPKTRCPGCTNPTEYGHYPWCAQAHPLSEALEQPEAYTLPDGTDVDEVLPMPGSPNDRLAQAVSGGMDEGLCPAKSAEPPHFVCSLPLRHSGDHEVRIVGGHTLARWPQAAQPHQARPNTLADLYARLDHIHDAVSEEDQ